MTTKVLTVTLNPSIDISYQVDDFGIGQLHRVSPPEKTAGGKGINVAKVLRILGSDVTATGFIGGVNGEKIKSDLDLAGVRHAFIDVPIETRNCININSGGVQTEIVERSERVDDVYRERMIEMLETMDDYDFVVISGSCIDGIDPKIYRDIIHLFNKKHIKVIVDVGPNILSELLNSDVEIFMIKPNESEMSAVMDGDIVVVPNNVKHVVISQGKKGVSSYGREAFIAKAPIVTVVNPVGSGDASIAGFVSGYAEGFENALISMVAAGTANAVETKTGHINLETFERLKREVEVYEN